MKLKYKIPTLYKYFVYNVLGQSSEGDVKWETMKTS